MIHLIKFEGFENSLDKYNYDNLEKKSIISLYEKTNKKQISNFYKKYNKIEESILSCDIYGNEGEVSYKKGNIIAKKGEKVFINEGLLTTKSGTFIINESKDDNTFTIVKFSNDYESVTALYIGDKLYKYGDYYHDKIDIAIEWFINGIIWTGKNVTVDNIICTDEKMVSDVAELGRPVPDKLSDIINYKKKL